MWRRVAVPDEQGLAEAGAGGDEAAVADGGGVAFVQGEDAVGGELGDAVAVGFEVVDEEDVLDAERVWQVADVEGPGEVGELEAAVADGAGAAEAGGDDLVGLVGLRRRRSSARNSWTTSSSEANSPAGNLWSRTGWRRPASKL